MRKHAAAVAGVTKLVAEDELYDPKRHDELWMLRYVLSHTKGGVPAAARAARFTLAWRAANGMDELAVALRDTSCIDHPWIVRAHKTHITPGAVQYRHPDERRGPILLCSLVGVDYHAAMRLLPREQHAASMRVMQEWFFLRCDSVTRRAGRLTKAARFVQVRGFKMGSLNREWLKMDANIAKEMEVRRALLPQRSCRDHVRAFASVREIACKCMAKIIVACVCMWKRAFVNTAGITCALC